MIRYKAGYKYQLAEDYVVELPNTIIGCPRWADAWLEFNGNPPPPTLIIRAGYAWDGPSGPTFDTPNFMRGSLVHDALYQLMRLGMIEPKSRSAADKLLRQMCIEDGMTRLRAWWVYQGVRLGGKAAAGTENRRPVLEAP